jgi:hypothetical protein
VNLTYYNFRALEMLIRMNIGGAQREVKPYCRQQSIEDEELPMLGLQQPRLRRLPELSRLWCHCPEAFVIFCWRTQIRNPFDPLYSDD